MSLEPSTPGKPTPSPDSPAPKPAAGAPPPPPPPLAAAGMKAPRGEPLPPRPVDGAAAEPSAAAPEAPKAPAPAPKPAEPEPAEDDAALEAEFAAALEGMGETITVAPGEIREAPIVAITDEFVFVDIGEKSEGVIPVQEFMDAKGNLQAQKGQVIPVEIRGGEDASGQIQVSYKAAVARLTLASLEEAVEKKLALKGRVTEVVKGGLMVDIGIGAFMPASQADTHRVEDLSTLLGAEIEVFVIEFNRRRKRAVVSRRAFLEEQRKSAREALMGTLHVDEVREGVVKNIQEFGVFVDLGGVDGFIPREEISWDRGSSPSAVFNVGDKVTVKVIRVDPAANKITLSRKRMKPDPWAEVESRYPAGSRVRGKVVSVTHFGAFVHLEEGITGMIHASDMSWNVASKKKPTDFVQEGDVVEAQVLEVNREKRRLSLGLKQIKMDPWAEVEVKYPVGSRVKGEVTSLTAYGAFVRLDEFIEGMIHISDISWDRSLKHPKQALKLGETVECVVLKADPIQRRLSLGLKQLGDSPFEMFLRTHPQGSVITGTVTRVAGFGAFVELAEGIEGLLHVSQFDEQRVEDPEKFFKVGDKVTCKITKVDADAQKISLSRKEALRQMDRQYLAQYMGHNMPGGVNLGEALRAAQQALNAGAATPAPAPALAAPAPKKAPAPPAEPKAPEAPPAGGAAQLPPLPPSLSSQPKPPAPDEANTKPE